MRNLIFLWALVSVCSCATRVEYVPVVRVQTDTLKVAVGRIDSVVKHDSVFVVHEKRGDSVFVTQTKVVTNDRLRVRHDTVYKVKVDTLRLPETVNTRCRHPTTTRKDYCGTVRKWCLWIGVLAMVLLFVCRFGR
nr:MAG TPA: hypothetical protein [Caudoviricetes sp.]